MNWSFNSDSYSTIRSIFVDKYGRPTRATDSTVQNRMGATFQKETLQWRGSFLTIQLSRYSNRLDESYASFMPNAYLDQYMKELGEEQKKAKEVF